MRALVLVDGQHAVAVVRAAIEHVASTIRGSTVVAAALVGPGETLVTGYLGSYRVLLSDLIVGTMAEPTFASSGAEVLEKGIRSVAPGVRVVHTVFRPFPLGPIFGSRVLFLTTAPASASDLMTEQLECEHGGKVVGVLTVWPTVKVWRPIWTTCRMPMSCSPGSRRRRSTCGPDRRGRDVRRAGPGHGGQGHPAISRSTEDTVQPNG